MANELPFSAGGARMVSDLEARVTSNGKTFATGRIAHNTRYFNKQTNTWEDGETSFFNITIFGSSAEHALNSLSKGDRVNVIGTLRIREFTRKDGSSGNSADVTVSNIGPDLSFDDVAINRSRNQGGQYAQGNQNTGGFQNNGGFQGNQNQNQSAAQNSDPWGGGQPAADSDPFGQPAGANDAFGGW